MTVALLFLVGATATASWRYLFGTKVSPLFGLSEPAAPTDARDDAGVAEDAGAPPREYFHGTKSGGLLHDERTFMPASKSLGGVGLPGAGQGLGGLGTRRAPHEDAGP